MLRVLSLFAGIGGFDLGLERTGFRTVAFCEIDPFCQAVLTKHWPGVPVYDDVRELPFIGGVDVVVGGFPCQPFSTASAGKQLGTADDRYLWPAMLAVIARERPAWVIGENVAGFDRLGLEQVVSDLEAESFEIWPLEIPACAVGHDHRRTRNWILAHSDRNRQSVVSVDAEVAGSTRVGHESRGARGAYGLSRGLDGHRRRVLGNAVVPQIPELIGHAILASLEEQGRVAA
jgi:DNA (cytosine-5)-methyltransferase 1